MSYSADTSSSVFRDMIDAGSGTKRIELDEVSDTIYEFVCTLYDGNFPHTGSTITQIEEDLVDFVTFVRKYDCQSILGMLVLYTRTRCEGDEVFLRLLVAMHLERDDLITELFEYYPGAFQGLSAGLEGFGVRPGVPSALYYSEFALVPSAYLWALTVAEVWDTESKHLHPWKDVYGPPRVRFEHCMKETKMVEGRLQRLKALRISI